MISYKRQKLKDDYIVKYVYLISFQNCKRFNLLKIIGIKWLKFTFMKAIQKKKHRG